MVKKKRKKRFQAVTAVKELAREANALASLPRVRLSLRKKKKPEKYKPTLGKLLDTE